ncbi:hypothetical protein SERLA73DRAFT_170577 [Serpula lacrymans var. lacrymans S7.3]|uniref:5'-Nucleotidase C-terminal domain-containing protein n=2 Tax=Serpula lacrymans var. lacrymans TaxID=341189 RepID=F8Q6C7_SERL3|nr:uncharacterized protein SERLADRAFT_451721 [Serpula lacrymans var. lacrymans S7.9]EGN96165.1 hypothetical protein SERLA73DRAFT_170577 [Serpula lacrymans var. lacrymans S7.3]EGO21709.1 hypothetical protein SERLADRAFT_451721 [Serpula lacrymans var. lacrymans S7.9]
MSEINLLHFNDVYRITSQKIYRTPGHPETIDVTQFATLLNDVRDQWTEREDGGRDGLVLFSGDVFSPSVESSVTRGSHMVPVMNALGPDISLTGNHDFDFGYPHLSKLINDTTFPWLLSNIIDDQTGRVPAQLHRFHVLERAGVRIGIIGLVEREWITTVSSWPPNFKYNDMAEVGRELSTLLRDPEGQHKCDFIIALTHARLDIVLAKDLFALSPAHQAKSDIASQHGVDIILGGHDHFYYVSKGVSAWEGYDTNEDVLGAENDHGDVLVIKSGTDFRDLSEVTLKLQETPKGSVRRKVIGSIGGKRHLTVPDIVPNENLKKIVDSQLSGVGDTLKVPVCITNVELDVRSQFIRVAESTVGNWIADSIRHAYDDALCMQGVRGSDGVLICAGTLRGDSVYPPGLLTLGNILEILPFEDPVVVLELDGEVIWDALEASLSTWPAQEGRFPVISGFRVSWDSRRPPGQRVLGIWLQKELTDPHNADNDTSSPVTPVLVDGGEIRRTDERKYIIVTREYMAQGHDGYAPLLGHKYLIDDENGQLMSGLIRKYLLGSRYVNRMARLANGSPEHLHHDTAAIIVRERERLNHHKDDNHLKISHQWQQIAARALAQSRSRAHYSDHIKTSEREHMSDVDCFDGQKARSGRAEDAGKKYDGDEDLLIIHPVIDGRLKDEGR